MRSSDWDDPRICEIGRRYALDAYDLASELDNYGADAARLLSPPREARFPLPDVTIPSMFADALMALLLSLPRCEKWQPNAPLGENVVVLKTRLASASGGGPDRPDAA